MEEHVAVGSAFLDIETTGLSVERHEITTIGVLKNDGFHVLIAGRDLDKKNLKKLLKDVTKVYTYNGKSFDMRFIREKLGVDIVEDLDIEHEDLMYTCRRQGLTGGQKGIERTLCIGRDIEGMSGSHAARLGKKWLLEKDEDALGILVHYNEEDVRNLSEIFSRLE